MPLGHAEFSELVATTLRNREDTLWDNVTRRHPLIDLIRSNEQSANGRAMVVNLELAEDTSTQWTDDSGTFSTDVSGEIAGSGVYEWSNPLVSSVRLRYKQLLMNQGKEQVINLLESHIKSMEKAHLRTIVEALHGRVNGGLPTHGLLTLDQVVSDAAYDADPAGDLSVAGFNVGGIDSTAQPVWQASRIELPADGAYSIRKAMRRVSNEVYVATGGNFEVDAIVAGRDVFEEFEDSFDDKVRYTDFSGGQTRFTEIQHGAQKVRLDPDCPPKRAYFLATPSWRFKSLAGTFMQGQDTQPIPGTLDKVHPVASVLSVGVVERRANAVLLRPSTAGGDA